MQNFLVKNKKIADKSSNNSLSTIIKKDLKLVNNFLTSNIKSEVPLIPMLSEYLLQSGGKRIRPALTILSSKLFGYKYGTRHIHLSACIEFIHMASLLHDDVVDESALRRGKKTANKIWGNKASVLVGDYLFSKAFQIMVADKNIDILKNLSETSKTLAQGEVMQLSISNNIDVEKSKYFKVIQDKTAKLFSSSAIVGGIIANTSKNNIKKLDDFGNYIGVAFQLLDDALDYELSEKKNGKKTGDDFKEGKVTLPVILALEKSNKSEKLFWKRVIEELDQNKDDFKKAQDLLIKYNTLNETKLIAEKYAKKAKNLLKSFPKNIYNNALVELTDFVFNREN